MTKILLGFIMDGRAGGVDKYLMNFYNTVKGKDTRVDFLSDRIDLKLKNYLEENESKLFKISSLKKPFSQYNQVKRILIEGNYDIVYLNVSTAIDFIAAKAAHDLKIKKIYIHSHSSGNASGSKLKKRVFDFFHILCKNFLYKYATDFLACSKKAGSWLFPEKIVNSDKFKVVYNAVDRSSFVYNSDIRAKIRAQLGVDNECVLFHAGYFAYPKNQRFLVEIMEELVKTDKDYRLFFAGEGADIDEIKSIVQEKNLTDYIGFLGWRKDIHCLIQGADMLLLPSFFEGLPVIGVEAQSSGLFSIFSNTISEETRISNKALFLPIEEGPEIWAKAIVENRNYIRENTSFLPVSENYDLAYQKKQLIDIAKGQL